MVGLEKSWQCVLSQICYFSTGKQGDKEEEEEEEEEGEDLANTEAADEEDLRAEQKEEANPQEEGAGVDEMTEGLGNMKIGGTHRAVSRDKFCLDFQFPYLMYDYEAKDRKVCTIDFLVYGVNKKFIRPKVNDVGDELHVSYVVPAFFAEDRRLELADTNIRHNTHKMTAFRDTCDALIKKHGDGSEEDPLLGEPQKVALPFIVEKERYTSGRSKPLRMTMMTSSSSCRRTSSTSLCSQ